MDWCEKVQGGAVLLTGNRRLARSLCAEYSAWRQECGDSAWPTPAIYSFGSWLQRCWSDVSDELLLANPPAMLPKLLSPEQEQVVWEDVVRSELDMESTISVPSAARQASQAWLLLKQWSVELAQLPRPMAPDPAAFTGWAVEYTRRCDANGWTDNAALADLIGDFFRDGSLPCPQRILLAGIDELYPQQKKLLGQIGCTIEFVAAPSYDGEPVLASCSDSKNEIAAAAAFARRLMESSVEPLCIGIIIHDLTAQRSAVERIFDETLHPNGLLERAGALNRLYNISLGIPLSDCPLISAGLQALELAGGEIGIEEAGGLLRSPFFSFGHPAQAGDRSCREACALALVDAALREAGGITVSLETLARLARANKCGSAAKCFEAAHKLANHAPESATAAARAGFVTDYLAALGWSKGRTCDSVEFQVLAKWRELLHDFALLDDVQHEPLALHDALFRIAQISANTIFQPRSAEVPIQIMGHLEANGLSFTHLWIAGLHDEVWPAPAQPNPFIPMEIQRQLEMPHSSAERELAFAQRSTTRLLKAAPRVIVSFPARDGDRDLQPSPLIAHLPLDDSETVDSTVSPLLLPQFNSRAAAFESEPLIAALRSGEKESLVGGTAIFRDHAACHFKSFAIHRLGANPLESPAAGLPAKERGIIVHRALEQLWRKLQSHAALIGAGEEELRKTVYAAACSAVLSRGEKLRGKLAEVEIGRVENLLLEWLENEKKRPAFTVLTEEETCTADFGGLSVRTVIDRMDELGDSSRMIIDYKTGQPNVRDWFGTRPTEPQIPVYCTSSSSDISAVTYAQIRPGDMKFMGVGRNGDEAEGVRSFTGAEELQGCESWSDVLAQWHEELTRLGRSFLRGEAWINPKYGPKTCERCGLERLCRVTEVASTFTLEDPEDEE